MRKYYSKSLLENIKKRCNGFCECCGIDIVLDKHHILEWSKNGLTELKNLIALCPSCHRQIPLVLSKTQQKYLQTWHHNNIISNRSLTHNILKENNKFLIGSNIYVNCKNILVVNDQNIISSVQEKDRFYINIVMLENFEPQILILNNKLIVNNSNFEITHRKNYICVKEGNQKLFELKKNNDEIYVRMKFLYNNKLFEFDTNKSIFPGNKKFVNCKFEGRTAISYKDQVVS
ncbi:MAG TPA: hypothetical protein DEP87_02915 [Candidatus Pacebacteria bacterium]|nr:hypothetical protein [Candidatus Paceibacterota bacterium]